MNPVELSLESSQYFPAETRLVELMGAVLSAVQPGFRGGMISGNTEGEVPWKYRKQARYGRAESGFDLTLQGEAFDSSSGIQESLTAEASSFGLPGGAWILVRASSHYSSAATAVMISGMLPAGGVAAVESFAAEHFG